MVQDRTSSALTFRLGPDGLCGVRFRRLTSSQVLREARLKGGVGTSVGRRLVSAHPFYNGHLSVLLFPGRVSLLCAWKTLQALGVPWSTQLLEGLSASQWVTEGLACGKAVTPYPQEGRFQSDTPWPLGGLLELLCGQRALNGCQTPTRDCFFQALIKSG